MTELTSLYIVEWDGGADYVCRDCAGKFVKDNGLEWENANSCNYTLENDKGLAAWCDYFGQIESDYPQACECGQWLKVGLTLDGENYIRENYETMPAQVIKYYQIEKESN